MSEPGRILRSSRPFAIETVVLFTVTSQHGMLPTNVLGGISTLLFSTVLAAHTVEVRSDVDCPSTSDVAGSLQPLLPGPAEGTSDRHLATLRHLWQPDGRKVLHLRLLRSDDSIIGDRDLPLTEDCRAMADSAAVVIAAWETEDPSALATAASAHLPAPARPPLQALVGVGAGAGFVGGTAIVGSIEAQMGRADSRWRLRFALMREWARRVDLGAGGADWQHTMAEVGLLLQGSVGSWFGSVDVGPTIGWVTVEGVGFDPNQQSHSLEYGVVGALRAGRRFGRWFLWAEARGNAWLRGQRALLTNSATIRADLPPGDLSVGAGTGFVFF
jgi:hypothetical protein